MPTQTQPKTSTIPNVEAAADRLRGFNEQIFEATKKSGLVYVDAYDKALNSFADFETKLADRTQVEWVSTLTKAHASFTRDFADVYTKATRELLK